MSLGRTVVTMLTALALLATLGVGLVEAAPSNAPSAETIAMTCSPNDLGISTADVVIVNNNGHWTPGHIVAINGQPANGTGIPLEFQGAVTDANGTVLDSFDVVKPGARNGVTDTATCSSSQTFTDGQGNTLTFTQTVTVFVAPRG